MNTHIIVTGGAGFIGSHLVDQLLENGHTVTVIDNLSNGILLNLEKSQHHPKFNFVQASVEDFNTIEPHFEGVHTVYHLAALADIVPSIEHPVKYHNANVNGTLSVLEACKKHNIKRVLYAASSSCYGIPDTYPTPETSPIRPEYPYAVTKNLGEQYALYWHQIYNLPVTSVRFFNVYGPRSRTNGTYGAVFGVFLAQKIHNKPYTVVGDGEQTRDFTFVTDIVSACIAAASSDNSIGQTYNVGSGNTYSINHLVSLLGGDKIHIPKRPGEPDSTFADITKIQTELGWEPNVSFEDGVAEMLNQIDYWKNAPVWDADSIAKATKDWFEYLGES
jgi:UDP-glucose 4-epimerase